MNQVANMDSEVTGAQPDTLAQFEPVPTLLEQSEELLGGLRGKFDEANTAWGYLDKSDALNAARSMLQDLNALLDKELADAHWIKLNYEVGDLDNLAEKHGYPDLDAMLAIHGFVKADSIKVRDDNTSEQSGAEETKAKRVVDKSPKVYQFLLKEEYNNNGKVDFKKGHNGTLKGTPPKGDNWHYKKDRKPDMDYYREAAPDEIAEMQRIREEYIKRMDEKREARAAKK